MGREIRRVPPGWKHPKNERGHYIPMVDRTWEQAMDNWLSDWQAWKDNPDEQARVKAEYGITNFAEWHGDPPGYEYHRPAFEQEPTHYQIYETVSEGTPTSPVFASLDEMRAWLLDEGYSEKATDRFIDGGWAPSFFMHVSETGEKRISEIGIGSLDFD